METLVSAHKAQDRGTSSMTKAHCYVMQGLAEEKALDIYHLIFAPTYDCNLRCKHCYLPNHDKRIVPRNIAVNLLEEWSKIVLDERGRYGGIFHVKGGEPFMVPYFWDLINRISSLQSLRLMITTNGTFTDVDIVRKLSKCNNVLEGNVSIVVSLDGASEKTHAMLRGQGQYAKTLEFIKKLSEYGLSFSLNCALHMGNICEISSYVDIAKAYGASQVNFLPFIPRGIGSGIRQLRIPPLVLDQQILELYEGADEAGRDLLAGSLPHIMKQEASGICETSPECVAAYRGLLYITPTGDVYTCPNMVSSNLSTGNILAQSIKEVLDNLADLYQHINAYSRPYSCTGERILCGGLESKPAIDLFYSNQKGTDEAINGTKSYCFNRNY